MQMLLCIFYHVAVRDFTADIHKALIQRVELGITEYCKYNWKTTAILLSSNNNCGVMAKKVVNISSLVYKFTSSMT